jgi:hypothetical protein
VRWRAGASAPLKTAEPIVARASESALAAEIERLPAERRLTACGSLHVYCAPAAELSLILREIGRLREVTFRAAGEGTGYACDLDRFDEHYWHLFAWDGRRRCIAGGYRLALTDEIVRRRGVEGLYTRTLFEYDERLLAGIGPALELGRSFVCEEWQRSFAPLLALWRGIGAFLVRHPECRGVFGAVSISSRYDTLSRRILVRFLRHAADPAAARLVRPLRPLPPHPEHDRLLESATVGTLDAVAGLVSAIERDGKSVPVLLRQYLNLNARLLGFSVDPAFGDALDGLMVADLLDVPPAMLVRIMGADGAASYLAHHRAAASRRNPVRTLAGATASFSVSRR